MDILTFKIIRLKELLLQMFPNNLYYNLKHYQHQ